MEKEPIWKDRKRYLGLPLSFTKFYIENGRLYIERGLFNTEIDEIILYRILDIKTTRSFGQKMSGVGTITLYSADSANKTIELKNIKKPKDVHRLISDIVEEQRKEKNIIGREIYGSAESNIDCDCDHNQ